MKLLDTPPRPSNHHHHNPSKARTQANSISSSSITSHPQDPLPTITTAVAIPASLRSHMADILLRERFLKIIDWKCTYTALTMRSVQGFAPPCTCLGPRYDLTIMFIRSSCDPCIAGPPPPPPTQQQFYGPQGPNGQGQPFFQYSQCTGKKKALCVSALSSQLLSATYWWSIISQIGINYIGQSAELQGCINDARNIQNFIMSEYPFHSHVFHYSPT